VKRTTDQKVGGSNPSGRATKSLSVGLYKAVEASRGRSFARRINFPS